MADVNRVARSVFIALPYDQVFINVLVTVGVLWVFHNLDSKLSHTPVQSVFLSGTQVQHCRRHGYAAYVLTPFFGNAADNILTNYYGVVHGIDAFPLAVGLVLRKSHGEWHSNQKADFLFVFKHRIDIVLAAKTLIHNN